MANVSACFAILAAIGFTATIFTSCRKNDSAPPPAAATSGKKMYNTANRSLPEKYSNYTYFIDGLHRSYTPQKCALWCWAACVETVLRHNGVNITQEFIVKKTYRVDNSATAPCDAGFPDQALNSLPSPLEAINGDWLNITCSPVTDRMSDSDIANSLRNKQPIIVGLKNKAPNGQIARIGHAVMMFGAHYDNGQLIAVLIADPHPDSDAIRSISAKDFFDRAYHFTKIQVTKM